MAIETARFIAASVERTGQIYVGFNLKIDGLRPSWAVLIPPSQLSEFQATINAAVNQNGNGQTARFKATRVEQFVEVSYVGGVGALIRFLFEHLNEFSGIVSSMQNSFAAMIPLDLELDNSSGFSGGVSADYVAQAIATALAGYTPGGGGGGGAVSIAAITDAGAVGKVVLGAVTAAQAIAAIGAITSVDTRLSDSRTPLGHTHLAANISDSTTAGRALLLAASVATQKTALALVRADVGLGSYPTDPLLLPIPTLVQTGFNAQPYYIVWNGAWATVPASVPASRRVEYVSDATADIGIAAPPVRANSGWTRAVVVA